jgi:preprotein translocase subunit SecG
VTTVLYIVQIILGITLIGLVLVQSKNSGAGAVFGSDTSFRTTRRGVEKTLFNFTVVVSLLFFLVALISVAIT